MAYSIFLFSGIAAIVGGGLWLIYLAFGESFWWGLSILLLTPFELLFVATHWNVSKRPFLIQLAGVGLLCIAIALEPHAVGVQP